jgi:hypothetical protein
MPQTDSPALLFVPPALLAGEAIAVGGIYESASAKFWHILLKQQCDLDMYLVEGFITITPWWHNMAQIGNQIQKFNQQVNIEFCV